MRREVACNLEVLYWNTGTSNIPIECHITLKSLLHQEIVKKVAKVVVVGFALKREQAGVLKEYAKLWRELTE